MSRAPLSQPKLTALTLRNARGDSIRVLTSGATLTEFNFATDDHGDINLILGYPHESSYLSDTAYHGAIAGRYCNRIANSAFTLDGQVFNLDGNENQHHLHGGSLGFNRRIWEVEQQQENAVSLRLHSADGDQGYPGNLDVLLHYRLSDTGALDIKWQATTDQDTIVGLTSHAYFNLAGHGDILDHYLRIPASHFTPIDKELIPTGEVRSVENTALDLRQFAHLRERIASDDPLIATLDGFDHNWAFESSGDFALRAQLLCPESKLLLSVSSSLPGLQCYSGNLLAANGVHGCHEGLCLEPQYYPDSPNQPHFPSPLLRAGETVTHQLRYEIAEVDTDFIEGTI